MLIMSRTELELLLQPVANSGDLKEFLRVFVDLSSLKRNSAESDSLEDVYRMFVEKLEDYRDCHEFRDIFERIEIKTYAVCKTIGLVMSIAMGKGRN